jgi:peroxiredoxin
MIVTKKIMTLTGAVGLAAFFLVSTALLGSRSSEAKYASQTSTYVKAPQIKLDVWINGAEHEQLRTGAPKGKPVLLVFWTSGCWGCANSMSEINRWDHMYREQGLRVIGIHSPKYEFVKDTIRLERSIEKYGMRFPVGLDSDNAVWKQFNGNNEARPILHLIDQNGYIRASQAGNIEPEKMENEIRKLLSDS